MQYNIQIKRIYDPVEEDDGIRILVDRLWPRGISKEKAKLDQWMKEIAPSHDLRKWYHQDLEKFEEFKERYIQELTEDKEKGIKLKELAKLVKNGKVTLLYGAKEKEQNQAVVLKELILKEIDN